MARLTRTLSLNSTNALANFECVAADIGGRNLLLLLDYDGTLAPIVNDPSQAYLPNRTREVLAELTKFCTTGIITGRSIEKVATFCKVDTLFYAGSHGFDIRGPSSTDISHQVATEHLPRLSSLKSELEEQLDGIAGASVEDNRFSVSVHYRNVAEEQLPNVFQAVDDVVSRYDQIRKGSGKKVVELRPDISWSKGHAVLWLLEALNLRDREDIITVYIGDDTTDEDAFKVLSHEMCTSIESCALGIGILVTEVTKMTHASYTLRDPHEVCSFLIQVLEMTKRRAEIAEAFPPPKLPGPISTVHHIPATFVVATEDANGGLHHDNDQEIKEQDKPVIESQREPEQGHTQANSPAQEIFSTSHHDIPLQQPTAATVTISDK